MNILDENIIVSQRRQLQSMGIHFKHIGTDIGQRGMKDRNEIIPLLHTLHRPTFFTHDSDFYDPTLRHKKYALVCLQVKYSEAGDYIRRVLRHPALRTEAQRMGKVIWVQPGGLSYWQVGKEIEQVIMWP